MPTTLTPDQHLAALRDAVSAFARHAQAAGLVRPAPAGTGRPLIGHQDGAPLGGGQPPWPDDRDRRDGAGRPARRARSTGSGRRHRPGRRDHRPPTTCRRSCSSTTPPARGRSGRAAVPRDHDPLRRRAGRRPRPLPHVRRHRDRPGRRRRRHRRAGRFGATREPAQRVADGGRVVAEESPTGWLVESARRRPSSRWSRATRSPTGDVRLEGPAVAVYLTLWNRSDETDLVDLWRSAPSRGDDGQVTIGSRREDRGTPVGKAPSQPT